MNTLWGVLRAEAIETRVRAFEHSVAQGVKYTDFERDWRKRLGLAFGAVLEEAGMARWSKRGRRYMLKKGARRPPCGQKAAKKILKGKTASKVNERLAVALALAGTLDAKDILKTFPISGKPHREPHKWARISFALGWRALPLPPSMRVDEPTDKGKACSTAQAKQSKPRKPSKANDGASQSQLSLFQS